MENMQKVGTGWGMVEVNSCSGERSGLVGEEDKISAHSMNNCLRESERGKYR